MRLGVIDVGSNTVHLLVVDAHAGAQPLPASSHKRELQLSEHVTNTGAIADAGRDNCETSTECLTSRRTRARDLWGRHDAIATHPTATRSSPT